MKKIIGVFVLMCVSAVNVSAATTFHNEAVDGDVDDVLLTLGVGLNRIIGNTGITRPAGVMAQEDVIIDFDFFDFDLSSDLFISRISGVVSDPNPEVQAGDFQVFFNNAPMLEITLNPSPFIVPDPLDIISQFDVSFTPSQNIASAQFNGLFNFDPADSVFVGTNTNYELTITVESITSAVPEPATWLMMVFGFAGVGMALKRRRRMIADI